MTALLLAALLVVTAATDGRTQPPMRRSLAGRLLVATDSLRDPRFSRTVVYVVRHRAEGAFGLIVNLPIGEIPLERALRPFGLEVPPGSGDIRVHYGGPVEERRGFVLHTPDWTGEGTTVIDDHFAITDDPRILRAIASGAGPRRALFCLGYAGWGPGQLDAEMTTGAWGVAPADERLVFDEDPQQKWIEATTRRLLDLSRARIKENVLMKTIDIHAHLVPKSLWQAADVGREWYGFRHEPGDGLGAMLGGGRRTSFSSPKVRFTTEERLKDMDAQGVDVQVVSIHTPFFGYHLDPAQGRALARDVNDEIAAMVRQWPQRFAGLATLPVQDVKAAIDELERAVTVLGLKGAELDTVVNGENWDEPKFLSLFKAAEALGAVLFFHPQPQHNFLMQRTTKYGLFNSLGVILDDAIVVAILIFGVLDACPDLKVCIAHGGGPACYAMGRLDRGWHGMPAERRSIPQPPSSYQRRLYYDTVVGSEKALRFLIDEVGVDRVVLGSDWPFVPWHPSPVTWVQGMKTLTQDEKEKILWRNLESLLRLS